ncbi:MAG: ABC transporter ATP-binding protein [Candidatus Aenigmatarchaeota archaeon]
MPLLEVINLEVYYNNFHALSSISITLERGEIVSIVGPHGSGKSTLLSTIQGLTKPAKGIIRYMGKRIDGLSPDRIVEMGIVYVPEGRRLFPSLTVKENLEMGAYNKRARPEMEKTLHACYDLFPILRTKSDHKASTLSAGEQQMLAIARGLMAKPLLMLLDEPFQGLSPSTVGRLCDTIKTIRDGGVSFIIVGQRVQRILKLGDRGYVLLDGRVYREGKTDDLLDDESIRHILLE